MTVLNPGFVENYVDEYYEKLDAEEKQLEAELGGKGRSSAAGSVSGADAAGSGEGVLEGDLNGADASAKLRGRGFTAKAQILNPRTPPPQQQTIEERFGAVRSSK